MDNDATHFAYSDESQPNVGRYRGLSLVTLGGDLLDETNTELRRRLAESCVDEFKWEKLRTAQYRFAAEKLLGFAVDAAKKGNIRVDILTWDVADTRHSIPGRDDVANLQRMYYHLFKNVLGERWPDGLKWHLLPDENSAMDWRQVQTYLQKPSARLEAREIDSTWYDFGTQLREKYSVRAITQCQSHKKPLIQLADLFVGLAVFSRTQYDKFEEWRRLNDPQASLLCEGQASEATKLSLSEGQRFLLLDCFDRLCKRYSLGVSLKSERGLKTFDPRRPINFWWYEAQHREDKAPRRHAKDRGRRA